MVLRQRHPTFANSLQRVTGHQRVCTVDAQALIQPDTHRHSLAGQRTGHAVAIAAHFNVAIPAYMSHFPVGGVIASSRQRLKQRRLTHKALLHHLMHRTVQASVRLLPEPLLGQLVEMAPTLE